MALNPFILGVARMNIKCALNQICISAEAFVAAEDVHIRVQPYFMMTLLVPAKLPSLPERIFRFWRWCYPSSENYRLLPEALAGTPRDEPVLETYLFLNGSCDGRTFKAYRSRFLSRVTHQKLLCISAAHLTTPHRVFCGISRCFVYRNRAVWIWVMETSVSYVWKW